MILTDSRIFESNYSYKTIMQKPYISLYGQMAYVLTAGPLLLLIPNVYQSKITKP